MAIGVAFKAFFAALFNSQSAERIRLALSDRPVGALPGPASTKTASSTSSTEAEKPKPVAKPAAPSRSDALTLLSTLQREARFVDLVCEPLDQFTDQQIGAAAREVLRDCRKTMERMFEIAPLNDQDEGATMEIPSSHSPARLRLVGKTQGAKGTVVHRGWKATKCDLPTWQGDKNDAMILAPTEVEVG